MSTKQLAKSGAQFYTHEDTNTLPKQMITYLNENIVYQKV